MKRLFLLSFAAAMTLAPVQTSAQIYQGIPDSEEYLDFVKGSYVNGTFGVQVGPYVGRFLSDPGMPQFSIYCVDYDHWAGDSAVRTAEIASGDLSATRLGASGLTSYTQAAYLASLFDSWDTLGYGTNKSVVWSHIHAAIWSTIRADPAINGSPVPNAVYAERDQLMTLASSAVAGGWRANGWYLLTPDRSVLQNHADWTFYDGQEFLIRTSVPEPSTLMLIGTGLILLIVTWRRRERLLEDCA